MQVPAQTEEKKGGIIRREAKPAVLHEEIMVFGELGNVVSEIKRYFGPNIVKAASAPELDYGRLSSGILIPDLCLAGGLRLSRGAMIYGNKSAGKSTIACRYVASAQRMFPSKVAVWNDIEGTFDKPWAARQGVDLNRLLLIEPESGEQATDIASAVLKSEETSIIVNDSIAMLSPMKEVVGSSEDSFPAIQARLVGSFLRKLNAIIITERHRDHFPVCLHLNQFRMSLNVMFGDPRVLPGGKALEFSTSQQIEISNKEHTNAEKKDKDTGGDGGKGTRVIYNEHRIKITKDKTGGRYKEGAFKLIRDELAGLPVGYIDQSKSIISFGMDSGVLEGSNGSFSFGIGSRFASGRKFRGQPEFLEFLTGDIEQERQIVSEIVQRYRTTWGVS